MYKMMPAFDPSFPLPSARTQPFRVGRLDTTAANGGELCATFEARHSALLAVPGATLAVRGGRADVWRCSAHMLKVRRMLPQAPGSCRRRR